MMTKLFFTSIFVNLLVLKFCFGQQVTENELQSVIVIFRHGDRTPVQPYKNDPYNNSSFWPVGWGQLTNTGKEQHYQLGKWLRQRYNNFLSPDYSEKDVLIRSTDVDRSLMSVEANLAGLFPPKDNQIWDQSMPWQPIPVHTTPEKQDALLAMKKPCKKYEKLEKALFKTPYFVNISHRNHDLYAYLSKNSGDSITSLESLEYLYNTLFIENLYNLTLPDWAQKVFPSKLEPYAKLSFATQCYNAELARLKTGPLMNEIITHFYDVVNNVPDTRKFLIYSGHDTTIANVLNTMGAFELHCPPYASTILLELRKSNNKSYVNIFYKNSTNPLRIIVRGCDFNCDLDLFKNLLKPVTLTLDEWEKECPDSFVFWWPQTLIGNAILLGTTGSLILMGFVLMLSLRWAEKKCERTYIQLPNEEYA